MTLEIVIVAAVRIAGSLLVLRWAFAGAIVAILVDFSDLFMRDLIDLGGLGDYQALDKWLDQVYLALFLIVALRWRGAPRTIAVALYLYRLVGFGLFEVTGERMLLVLFPNVFEVWFLVVAGLAHWRPRFEWTPRRIGAALLVCTAVKEVQEVALHGLRLFDRISTLDAIEIIRRWLAGG